MTAPRLTFRRNDAEGNYTLGVGSILAPYQPSPTTALSFGALHLLVSKNGSRADVTHLITPGTTDHRQRVQRKLMNRVDDLAPRCPDLAKELRNTLRVQMDGDRVLAWRERYCNDVAIDT